MKEDRDQTSCSPRDTDSYSVSHYHSDLNSIFTVCFSPEGSIHQAGGRKQIAHCCRFCQMQISSTKLSLFQQNLEQMFTERYRLLTSSCMCFLKVWQVYPGAFCPLQGAAQISPNRHSQLPQNRPWLPVSSS